ncbi:putative lipoprotein [Bacteroidetes bacterium oral taxon 272 str. F0290]|nr:putative lipoprotein [Bacteroidetes bacterium oral taxon 272 str. F0290]
MLCRRPMAKYPRGGECFGTLSFIFLFSCTSFYISLLLYDFMIG